MELGHDRSGLCDRCVDLWLEGEVGGYCGPQVLEAVDGVELVVPNVDARRSPCALTHYFRLLEADGEAKFVTSMCETVNQSLEGFLSVRRQRSVIGEEGLSDGDMPDLGLCSESGQVIEL